MGVTKMIAVPQANDASRLLMFIGSINWLVVAWHLTSADATPIPDLFKLLAGPISGVTPENVRSKVSLKRVQTMVYFVVGCAAIYQGNKVYAKYKEDKDA